MAFTSPFGPHLNIGDCREPDVPAVPPTFKIDGGYTSMMNTVRRRTDTSYVFCSEVRPSLVSCRRTPHGVNGCNGFLAGPHLASINWHGRRFVRFKSFRLKPLLGWQLPKSRSSCQPRPRGLPLVQTVTFTSLCVLLTICVGRVFMLMLSGDSSAQCAGTTDLESLLQINCDVRDTEVLRLRTNSTVSESRPRRAAAHEATVV